ncbi:hypothetical protein V5O48_001839 [Marasmius crinis-equi]|uniref:Uncharacterized protein n=1 Tax=Marasmius crinis-equi TaxID=585013 RepID=A0ABR3FXB9_9AGAR
MLPPTLAANQIELALRRAGLDARTANSVLFTVFGVVLTTEFGNSAKEALAPRYATSLQLLDIVLELEGIDPTKLLDEAKRLQVLESSAMAGRLGSLLEFLHLQRKPTSFTLSTNDREREWKERLDRQLRPVIAVWMDGLTSKMASNLHQVLPDTYDKSPKFDLIMALVITQCRIIAEIQPLLYGLLDQLQAQWSSVAEKIDKEQEVAAIKEWCDTIVQPALTDLLDKIQPPSLDINHADSLAEEDTRHPSPENPQTPPVKPPIPLTHPEDLQEMAKRQKNYANASFGDHDKISDTSESNEGTDSGRRTSASLPGPEDRSEDLQRSHLTERGTESPTGSPRSFSAGFQSTSLTGGGKANAVYTPPSPSRRQTRRGTQGVVNAYNRLSNAFPKSRSPSPGPSLKPL